MNIEDMAHDFAMAALTNPTVKLDGENLSQIVSNSWVYAEAMQAEFNKRKPQGLPEAIQDDFQVDWSLAPENTVAWSMHDDNITGRWTCHDSIGRYFKQAPSFSYKGDWKDSLRQRP